MARLEVAPLGPDEFEVRVVEGSSETSHRVTLSEDDLQRLGAGASPQRLLEECFRFLLEREPKESILSSFELPVITRYFPEYPEEIRARLSG